MPALLTLGIDLGTSGIRAIAIDGGDTIHGQGTARIAREHRRDPAAIWQGVVAALDALRAHVYMPAIRAIAIDGTSGTLIVTDDQATPIGPATLYSDRATPDSVARIAAIAP
ncbi:MAG: FGGY family carbohydrate kinase, partial [Acidiphilium sp.]|nr:FGGY family carbohydrate kinase [Acidiphilium sp.]